MTLKLYTQKNNLESKFSTKQNARLSTSILIYSIKQTLGPKQIRDIFLDPKKYQGCKFSTPKNTSDLPVRYSASMLAGEPLEYICRYKTFVGWNNQNQITSIDQHNLNHKRIGNDSNFYR